MAPPRKPLEERLWDHVEIGTPDECWLWQGETNGTYGRVRNHRGPSWSSHRLAWRLTFGAIPEGLCVLHKCDVPLCCNPAHLFLGTLLDNNRDMFAKGR